jgi:hypothetical protein
MVNLVVGINNLVIQFDFATRNLQRPLYFDLSFTTSSFLAKGQIALSVKSLNSDTLRPIFKVLGDFTLLYIQESQLDIQTRCFTERSQNLH